MRWQLAQGEHKSAANEDLRRDLRAWGVEEDAIEEYIERSSGNQPPPDLDEDNAEYLIAFHQLSPSRPVGFGMGAIPVSEIHAYCDLFDVDEVETFFYLIRALDAVYLGHMAKTSRRA